MKRFRSIDWLLPWTRRLSVLPCVLAIFVLVSFLTAVSLPPASGDIKEKEETASVSASTLAGNWKDASGLLSYTLSENGDLEIHALGAGPFRGTYELQGDQLVLRYTAMGLSSEEHFPVVPQEDGTLQVGKTVWKNLS